MAGRASLPSAGEPLMLADGVQVNPTPAPKSHRRIAVPTASQAQHIVAATRRKLSDLPIEPRQMNAVAALLIYTAFGLSNDEICVATGVTHQQLELIRNSPAYEEMERSILTAVHHMTKAEVQSILANAEVTAANAVVQQVEHANPDISYRAAKDVLDRRGYAPKQVVDVRAQMMSSLRIEVVDKRGPSLPTLDIDTSL